MRERSARTLLAFALGSLVACAGTGGHDAGSAAVAPETKLDAFAFRDLAGSEVRWSPAEGLSVTAAEARRPRALLVHAFQADCGACAEQAGELEQLRARHPNVAIVGVDHRLGAPDVRTFAERSGAAYPLLLGADSPWAERWGRGDATYVVDPGGTIVYSQVGFHPSDVARWDAVLKDLAAGRAARWSGPHRDAVVVHETLPTIELPRIDSGGDARIGLDGDGALAFEQAGEHRRFRAAVGFFSRY
jgi:hypothetical protein